MSRLVVVGDTMLDVEVTGTVTRVSPDAPVPVVEVESDRVRPGGAGMAALLAAGAGADVTLITNLGSDDPGDRCREILDGHGVEVVDLGCSTTTPEKVRVWAGEQVMIRLDREAPAGRSGPAGPIDARVGERLAASDGVVVADYGRGLADRPDLRHLLSDVCGSTPLVWDPHPRGGTPLRGSWLATPNLREAVADAQRIAPGATGGDDIGAVSRVARVLVEHWSTRSVAVTMGDRGALLETGSGAPLVVPAVPVSGDACGAGDRFAIACAMALIDGALLSEAVEHAVVQAAGFVAAGGARALGQAMDRPPDPVSPADGARPGAIAPVERVRQAGGTVVAAGGCFDLLHAGHVRLLEHARSLGDCLVVCLNSDRSVRRLKGSDRPVVPAADRAQVLLALAAVDAVVEFDEDTPARLLEDLRPDLFVKGADYIGVTVQEQTTLDQWGGQVVVVPYSPGRSTTRLLEEVFREA